MNQPQPGESARRWTARTWVAFYVGEIVVMFVAAGACSALGLLNPYVAMAVAGGAYVIGVTIAVALAQGSDHGA